MVNKDIPSASAKQKCANRACADHFSVYDLPQDILSTLARKDDTGDESQNNISSSAKEPGPDLRTESAVGAKSCSLCGVAFHTVEDQRSHNRSDLHSYNLKQKIRGAKPVTEGDFEKLVGGS